MARGHLEEVEGKLHTKLVGMSIWADGVLMSWDRSESIQCFIWGLPGMVKKEHRFLRFPFTVLPKLYCSSGTFDFVLQLMGWSLTHLLKGEFPRVRHDGSEFEPGFSKNHAGQPLGIQAVVVEMKGDWEFFSDVLHLPRWNNTEGICCFCRATKAHLTQSDLQACWRQPEMRLNHSELVQRLSATRQLSPIWQFPFFKQVCLKLDWLHVADQGVTATWAGSMFCLMVDPPGRPGFGPTLEDRRLTLWNMLLLFYKQEGMKSDRLKCLPLSRFRHKPPCLKGQAATVRKIVPFLKQLLKHLDMEVEEHRWAITATVALGECYKCLSHTCSRPEGYLKGQAAIFGEHVAKLHMLNPERYALLPKMHAFQELCSMGIQPSDNWLYREEDFGGSLAQMSHRDGGWDTALSTSRLALSRFCMNAAPPVLGPSAGVSSSSATASA